MDSGIIFGNKILDVTFISMFAAQFYKIFSTLFKEKKWRWQRFWETGGMPSSHSSSVVALTTAVAISQGTKSIVFAICVVFSIVVMYDAAGVRKAAGKHAGIINEITDFFHIVYNKNFNDEKLKVLLGHSRSEVLAGAILGVMVAYAMKWYLV
jgi:acid phosphatase family membrane protein YuiD